LKESKKPELQNNYTFRILTCKTVTVSGRFYLLKHHKEPEVNPSNIQ